MSCFSPTAWPGLVPVFLWKIPRILGRVGPRSIQTFYFPLSLEFIAAGIPTHRFSRAGIPYSPPWNELFCFLSTLNFTLFGQALATMACGFVFLRRDVPLSLVCFDSFFFDLIPPYFPVSADIRAAPRAFLFSCYFFFSSLKLDAPRVNLPLPGLIMSPFLYPLILFRRAHFSFGVRGGPFFPLFYALGFVVPCQNKLCRENPFSFPGERLKLV